MVRSCGVSERAPRPGTNSRAASTGARSFRAATSSRSKPCSSAKGAPTRRRRCFSHCACCSRVSAAISSAVVSAPARCSWRSSWKMPQPARFRRAAGDADRARAHDVRAAARQARRRDLPESAIVGLRLQAHRLEEGGEEQTLLRADDFDPAARRGYDRAPRSDSRRSASRARRTREAHLLEERFSYEPFAPPARAMLDGTEDARELSRSCACSKSARSPSSCAPVRRRSSIARPCMQYTGPWRIQERR